MATPAITLPVFATSNSTSRWCNVRDHILLLAVIFNFNLLGLSSSLTLVLGGTLSFFTYLILALREMRRAPLKFSPLSFYFLWYSNGYGLSAIYIGTLVTGGRWLPFSVTQISPDHIVKGYLIALLGSVALHFGMEWRRPVMVSPTQQETYTERNNYLHEILFVILLWTLGILQAFRPDWFSFIGILVQPLQRATIAAVCFIAMNIPSRFGLTTAKHKIFLVVGTMGLLLANVQAGSKAFVMFAFFPVFWMFIARRSLRQWLPLIIIGLITFYLLLVAPVINTSRLIREGSDESVVSLILRSYQSLDQMEDLTWQAQVEAYLERQFDPTPIGFLVGDVEVNGFRNGETMEYVAYAFIPRFLWPDKPSVTRGAWFTSYLGFASDESSATTSTGITAIGELYWNFGLLGVVIGMILIGSMIGGLWRMASANPISGLLQMMLYTTLMLNMPDMPEAISVVVGLTAMYLIFGSIKFILPVSQNAKKASNVIITT